MTNHQTLDALLGWATAGGIDFDPVEIRIDRAGGRGAFARHAIAIGDELVGVPRRMLVTDVDMASTAVGVAMSGFAGMLCNRNILTAVWLALERRDATSPWKPFLDAMPAAYPWMPFHRSDDDLNALGGTRALRVIAASIVDFDSDHAFLGEMLEELAGLDRAELAWGRCVARSRSFRIDDDDGSALALVPVADMINHGRANASWGYRAATQRLEVRASRTLGAGDEIYVSYGTHDNARNLTGYGFAVAENLNDEVALHFGSTDTRSFAVGRAFDRRFKSALTAAARFIDSDDVKLVLAAVAVAADEARARIDAVPDVVTGDPLWIETCAVTRDGERAVLDHIAAAARASDTEAAFTAALGIVVRR